LNPEEYRSTEAGRVIRTPTGYWAFLPAPLPPALSWPLQLVSTLAQAERDLSRLTTLAASFPFPRLLVQPFMRNEAVVSSRIEGTRASLVDVYAYEAEQLSFFEQTDDVREVFNYVRAMEYGLERIKTFPISLRLIREVHAKLLENVRGGNLTPGEFRRSQNWIGPVGSNLSTAPYVPPPVEEMHTALDALEKFIHNESGLPGLVRAGLIHYQFEAIHPFLDGNGRVGRLLVVLLLCDWGLLPQPLLNLSVYFEQNRQAYYDHLLGVSQDGEWEAWMRFFLRGVSEQSQESVTRLDTLQAIRSRYEAHVKADYKPERMALVIDFLFSRPVLTVRQLSDGVGLPFKTAQAYLAKLVQAGVLREITGFSRNRVFQSDEILQALH
jgi:Fic family protein